VAEPGDSVPPTLIRPSADAVPPTVVRTSEDQVPPTVVRTGEDAVPPTVLRGAEDVVPPTIIRESGGGPAEASPADASQGYFPAELRADYEPVAMAGSGTEADVWHARRLADGQEVAVKVHRPGAPVDLDLLRHLENPRFRRHVPELHGFGYAPTPYGSVGWVAMEYLPATLDVLMATERAPGGPIPAARAREILAELAATIRYWQDPDEVDRTPIDVKPDNFGVRQTAPLELVVIDFGGVVKQTTTQRYGDIAAARAYMSPEGIIGMRHQASPWWSLGVIAYELATGTTRFRAADGRLLDDRVLMSETVLADVDLSEAPDERWRLLLTGLLTRNPDDRWGWDQVSSWLAGGHPAVASPAMRASQQSKARAPITFRQRSYWSPADLAAALFEHPEVAASWLQTDAGELGQWLRADVADNLFDTRKYLTAIAAKPSRAPLAILAFGAAYSPELTPSYRGARLNATGLIALCAPEASSEAMLSELFEQEILPVAAQYRCSHAECLAGGRCLILDGLAEDVPQIMTRAEQAAASALISQAVPLTGARGLTAAERNLARATAVRLTLGSAIPGRPSIPELVSANPWAQILRGLGPLRRTDPAWWTAIVQRAGRADPGPVAGRAELVAGVALTERVRSERARVQLEARDRLRTRAASVRYAPFVAVCAFLALTLLNWSATVIGFAISVKDRQLLSPAPQELFLDHQLGRIAAHRASDLLPLIVVAAIASALPRVGRVALACGVVGLAAVGFLAVRTSAFPVAITPGFVRSWLAGLAVNWKALTGIAAVFIGPAVAIISLVIAVRLSRAQDPPGRARRLRLPAVSGRGQAPAGRPDHVRGAGSRAVGSDRDQDNLVRAGVQARRNASGGLPERPSARLRRRGTGGGAAGAHWRAPGAGHRSHRGNDRLHLEPSGLAVQRPLAPGSRPAAHHLRVLVGDRSVLGRRHPRRADRCGRPCTQRQASHQLSLAGN